MKLKTHITAGVTAGVYLATKYINMPVEDIVPAVTISGMASLIPDVDVICFRNMIRHRGITHSLLGLLIFAILMRNIIPPYWIFAVAGYGSHILLDMLTVSGVMLLYPVKTTARIPLVRTGSVLERFVILPIIIIAMIACIKTV